MIFGRWNACLRLYPRLSIPRNDDDRLAVSRFASAYRTGSTCKFPELRLSSESPTIRVQT